MHCIYLCSSPVYLFIKLNRKWWWCRPSNSSCLDSERENRINFLSWDWRAAGNKRIRRSRWGLRNSSLIKFCSRIQLSTNLFLLLQQSCFNQRNTIKRRYDPQKLAAISQKGEKFKCMLGEGQSLEDSLFPQRNLMRLDWKWIDDLLKDGQINMQKHQQSNE